MTKTLRFLLAAFLLFSFHSSFAQVTLISDSKGINGGFALPGGKPYLLSNSGLLYSIDGTSASVISNKVFRKGDSSAGAIYKGEFYFPGFDSTNHQRLWATDGVTMRMVKDINPSGYADILHFFSFNNLLYFTANDGVHGIELWVTDSTTANTHLVTDINGSSTSSFNDNVLFFINGSYVLFSATGAGSVPGFYKLTSSGVSLIKNNITLNLGYYASGTSYLAGTGLGSKVIFGGKAAGFSTDLQVWTTDGTAAGTFMLKDFGANSFKTNVLPQFTYLNGKVLFDGYSAATGTELWSTDGTVANTVLLKDINDSANGSSNPDLFNSVVLNNKLYFDAYNSAYGYEYWSTDGTGTGTTLLKDINPGNGNDTPAVFLNQGASNRVFQSGSYIDNTNFTKFYSTYNGKFYFTANDGTNGRQLWSSDGTTAGTQLVKIINPKGDAFATEIYTAFFTTTGIYFQAFDSTDGTEPWVTNGTSSGTSRVYDVNRGIGGSYPSFLFVYNSQLYFTATNNDTTFQLYKINTPLTVLPVTLLNFNVVKQNNTAQLTWQTANEINTSYFNIQRSTDGRSFATVGRVEAKGSNKVNNDYAYVDDISQSNADRLYYRLQEVDNDGKFNYSGIKIIELNKNSILFTISPNPAKDYINIVASDNIANAQVSVTDMNGRMLYTGKQNFTANQQIKIPTSQFAKQVLIVTINTTNGKQEFKVVKE